MSRTSTKATLSSGNVLSILNCLMQLRKVCCHPDLFETRPIVSPFLMEPIRFHFPALATDLFEDKTCSWKPDLSFLNLCFASPSPPHISLVTLREFDPSLLTLPAREPLFPASSDLAKLLDVPSDRRSPQEAFDSTFTQAYQEFLFPSRQPLLPYIQRFRYDRARLLPYTEGLVDLLSSLFSPVELLLEGNLLNQFLSLLPLPFLAII